MLKEGFIISVILVGHLTAALAQEGPYSISGHIISDDKQALPNATILFNDTKVYISDIHGDFEISRLRNGQYNLKFFYMGYDSIEHEIRITDSDVHMDVLLNYRSQELAEVVVEGDHFKTGRIEQSQTIQSVSQSFIRTENSGTLINSIQKIPGISAINTGVGIAKPVIRGMSSNRVLVMDKGVKQEGQQWGADHGLEIDQYDPEKVEIIKGPSSLLYGSDGMGGVLKISPKGAKSEDGLGGQVFLTYKTNNQLIGTSTFLEGRKNENYFNFRFSSQNFGDYTVPANEFTYNGYVLPIENNRLKNTAGNERDVSLTVGTRKGWGTTSLSVSNFHQNAGLFPGATGIPREYQLIDDGNYREIELPRQKTNHFKVVSNSTFQFKKDWMEIDIGYQQNIRTEEGEPHAHGYQPTSEGNLALKLNLNTISTNIRYFHSIGNKINSTWGLQGQYQDNSHEGYEFLLPKFQSYNIGMFSYFEYTPSHLWTLNAGLRYDYGVRDIMAHMEPDYTTPIEEDSVLRNPDIFRSFNDFSGALGLSYYPTIHFNTKLNIGTSFRMPTAPELSSNGIHHGTFRHEKGNPNLKSERGIQADLNVTYTNSKLYTVLTPFVGYFADFIYLNPQPKFSDLPSGGLIYEYTQNNALFTGLEFQFDYEIYKSWDLNTGLEYVWNKNLDTHLPLPFTPPFSIFGEIQFSPEIRSSKLINPYFSFNVHYYDAQNRVDRNEAPTDGYTLLSFNAGIDFKMFNQWVEFRMGIQNLSNKSYMNHLSRYRLLNLPEPGRNIVFSLSIPFQL